TSRQLIDGALAADPVTPRYRRARAELELATGDFSAAWADYDRALQLDPNDMSLRLEYANALREKRRGAEARKQYELTLWQNSRLAPDEIKRLTPEQIEQITRTIQSLPAQ